MEYVFISDVHGNLPALEKVLGEAGGLEVFCAGDLVGYNPWPNEVIELMKSMNVKCVLGNHDYAAVTGDASDFNFVAVEALGWTRKKLTAENMSYLKSIPKTLSTLDFFMVHGSPRDPLYEYVYPENPYLEGIVNEVLQDVVVLGHTHFPFVRKAGGKIVFNPGSVGQPRDGNPKASYAVFNTETREVVIRRVEYPISEVAGMIEAVGLPSKLAQRLYFGV